MGNFRAFFLPLSFVPTTRSHNPRWWLAALLPCWMVSITTLQGFPLPTQNSWRQQRCKVGSWRLVLMLDSGKHQNTVCGWENLPWPSQLRRRAGCGSVLWMSPELHLATVSRLPNVAVGFVVLRIGLDGFQRSPGFSPWQFSESPGSADSWNLQCFISPPFIAGRDFLLHADAGKIEVIGDCKTLCLNDKSCTNTSSILKNTFSSTL